MKEKRQEKEKAKAELVARAHAFLDQGKRKKKKEEETAKILPFLYFLFYVKEEATTPVRTLTQCGLLLVLRICGMGCLARRCTSRIGRLCGLDVARSGDARVHGEPLAASAGWTTKGDNLHRLLPEK